MAEGGSMTTKQDKRVKGYKACFSNKIIRHRPERSSKIENTQLCMDRTFQKETPTNIK